MVTSQHAPGPGGRRPVGARPRNVRRLCLALLCLAACGDGGDAAVQPPPETGSPAGAAGPSWRYFHSVDAMTDAIVRGGCVTSADLLRQPRPYGNTPVELCLREDAKGREVIVRMVGEGQFMYRAYASDPIPVRFDLQPPEQFRAIGPVDFMTTEFAIRPAADFERRMLSAQRVLLEPAVYQGGRQIVGFNVAGFAWPEGPVAATGSAAP